MTTPLTTTIPDHDNTDEKPEWLTIREAARVLRVHRKTVERWIAAGKLPVKAIPGRSGQEYRIKREDVMAYLERGN